MASGSAGRGKNIVPSEREAKEKLDALVYDYLVYVGAKKSATSFLSEAGIDQAKARSLDPPGFLHHWWTLFWDLYSAVPERRDSHDPTAEARHFMDMVKNEQVQAQHIPNGMQHTAAAFGHPQAGAAIEPQVQTPMAPPTMYSQQMQTHQANYGGMPMSPSYLQQPAMRQRMLQQQQPLPMAPSPGQQVLHSPAMSPAQPPAMSSIQQRPAPRTLSLGPAMQPGYANAGLRHGQAGNGVAATPGVMPNMGMVMSAGTPTGGAHPGTPTMGLPARSSPAWTNQIQPCPPAHHHYVPDGMSFGGPDQGLMRLHPGPDPHLQDQPQMLEIHKMKQAFKDDARQFEKGGLGDPGGDYFPSLGIDPSHIHPGAPG